MTESPPDPLYRAIIRDEWLDYNGHLNEAYYVLVFSHASDVLIDWIGMDAAWRAANRMTVYTLETHVRYLQEVGAGVEVVVHCRLLGIAEKRARLFHAMHRADDGRLLATAEMLIANVDASGPRTAPWADAVRRRLDEFLARRAAEPLPDGAGRAISLDRRPAA